MFIMATFVCALALFPGTCVGEKARGYVLNVLNAPGNGRITFLQ